MLLSSPGTEQEDTPLTLRSQHARGSFILLRLGPPGVSAEPLPARLSQLAQPSRKIVFFGGRGPRGKVRAARRAAAGRREGHVPSQSQRTPASHRPPSLHRLLRGLPGTGLGTGPRERLAPNPPPPASSGSPAAPPGPGHEPGGPSGLPSGRPVPPPPGVLHSRRARGGRLRPRALRPRADRRPASSFSGQPRLRPTGHRPPPTPTPNPPACARQRPLAPAPHLRSAPAAAHRPDRLCTPEVTSPGRPRPRPKRTPVWLRTQRLGAEPSLRRQGGGGPLNLLP